MPPRRQLLVTIALVACVLTVVAPVKAEESQSQVFSASESRVSDLALASPVLDTPTSPAVAEGASGRAWQQVGPEGGNTTALCRAGADLYALTGGEVFVLRSAEQSWRPVGLDEPYSLACAGDGSVFVGAYGAIYRSLDAGATWAQVHSASGRFGPGTADTGDPERVLFCSTGGVVLSTDGGDTWLEIADLQAWRISSARGLSYAIASDRQHLLRSDNGRLWSQLPLPVSWLDDMIVDRGDGLTVYLMGGSLLYSSKDGGWTWDEVAGPAGNGAWWPQKLLWADEDGSLYLVAGRGSEGGGLYRLAPSKAWEEIASPVAPEFVAAIQRDAALWLATAAGVFRLGNDGVTWQPANAGLRGVSANGIILSGDTVYLASDSGLYTWLPGWAQWAAVSTPFGPTTIVGIAADTNYLYAATWWALARMPWDGSGAWETVLWDQPQSITGVLAVSSGLYVLRGASALLRSDTRGSTWQEVSPIGAGVYTRAVAEQDGQLLVGTDQGLYRLAGDSWQALESLPEKEVQALLAIDTGLYAATNASPPWSGRGLFVSLDGGTSWEARDYGMTSAVTSLAVGTDGALYAGSQDSVFFSTDGGQRWRALDTGLPPAPYTSYARLTDGVTVSHVVVVPSEEGDGLLAASSLGVIWLPPAPGSGSNSVYLPLVRQPALPKAVLIVGPVDPPDHTSTHSFMEWADRLGAILAQHGFQVEKLYLEDATWPNVRRAVQGASVIVYKGHGFGFGEVPSDASEMGGGLNGFCLYNPDSPAGAQLATQDMLLATTDLGKDALVFVFACFSGGSSASDTAVVSQALAQRRVEGYAYTFQSLGASAYLAGVDDEAILEALLASPSRRIQDVYCQVQGCDGAYHFTPFFFPDQVGLFRASMDGSGRQTGWGAAMVADPDWTAERMLLP